MGKKLDLTNKRFHKLKVITCSRKTKEGSYFWLCQCDCGNQKDIRGASLVNGNTWSCGCLNKGSNFKGLNDISLRWFNKIKRGALKRNIKFEITINDIWNLYLKQKFKCALSGVDIKFYPKIKDYSLITASLDRIDSSKSYTLDNVQLVHKIVNIMKWSLPNIEFITWCKIICKNNKIKQVKLKTMTTQKRSKLFK